MANNQPGRTGKHLLADIGDWMEERNVHLRTLANGAEAAGRELWDRSTRSGGNLSAPRPSDVLALGVRAAPRPRPIASRVSATVVGPVVKLKAGATPGVRAQVGAASRGALDAVSFGVADRVHAGWDALGDQAKGQQFGSSYAARMAQERARDAYDAKHFGPARITGQVLGTGAQVLALGPLEGLAVGGSRIVQATPLIAREVGVLGAAGAGSGILEQGVSDLISRKPSSLGTYAGSALGGTVGALAARSGQAGYSGAASGVATSVAQDVFNGRPISIDGARNAAALGGGFGVAGGLVGRVGSNRLPSSNSLRKGVEPPRLTKETLGESFSRVRTAARGETTGVGGKRREYLRGGGYTYPDQRTFRDGVPVGLIESKFGLTAELSKRQTQAFMEDLAGYRVDHKLPRDVGVLFGVPMAGFGYQTSRPREGE